MVSEFLLFSDFHAHNFRYGSSRVHHPDSTIQGLYNSRLIDCVNILQEIGDYAETHNIKTVLFGGDLFHKRTVLDTDVLTVIHKAIEALSKRVSIVMIPGNHDYGDRAGHVHSLSVFNSIENVQVVDKPTHVFVESQDFHLFTVPYTDDPVHAREWLQLAGLRSERITDGKPKILLAHLGMQGAKVGSDYVLIANSDIEATDVPYDNFTACFFGHYHQHQKLFPNGWFVGATHHHNWSDAGTTRGFLHVRASPSSVEFKQIETSAPRFFNIRFDDPATEDIRERDFVKLFYPAGCSSEEIRTAQNKIHSSFVEPVVMAPDVEDLVLAQDSLDPATLVERWVEHLLSEEEQAEYIKLGKDLLREAQGLSL